MHKAKFSNIFTSDNQFAYETAENGTNFSLALLIKEFKLRICLILCHVNQGVVLKRRVTS